MSDNWFLAMIYVSFVSLFGFSVWAFLTYTFLFGLAALHVYKHEKRHTRR